MKKGMKYVVIATFALMLVLISSTPGQAKVNRNAKNLAKEFTNLLAYSAAYSTVVDKKYQFNLASHRQKACAMNQKYAEGKVSFNATSKKLFGRMTPVQEAMLGDWGEDRPTVSVVKMVSAGKKRYVLRGKVVNRPYVGKKETWGYFRLSIKKSKKSTYGYVATKLQISKKNLL